MIENSTYFCHKKVLPSTGAYFWSPKVNLNQHKLEPDCAFNGLELKRELELELEDEDDVERLKLLDLKPQKSLFSLMRWKCEKHKRRLAYFRFRLLPYFAAFPWQRPIQSLPSQCSSEGEWEGEPLLLLALCVAGNIQFSIFNFHFAGQKLASENKRWEKLLSGNRTKSIQLFCYCVAVLYFVLFSFLLSVDILRYWGYSTHTILFNLNGKFAEKFHLWNSIHNSKPSNCNIIYDCGKFCCGRSWCWILAEIRGLLRSWTAWVINSCRWRWFLLR